MKTIFRCTFILLAITAEISKGLNVLLALPVSTANVNQIFCGVAKALVSKGHLVTFVSSRPPNFSHSNLTSLRVVSEKVLLQDLDLYQLERDILKEHVKDALKQTGKAMWETTISFKDLSKQNNDFHVIIMPKFLNEIGFRTLDNFSGTFITLYHEGVEKYIVNAWEDEDDEDLLNRLRYSGEEEMVCQRSVAWQNAECTTHIPEDLMKVAKIFNRDPSSIMKKHETSCLSLINTQHIIDGPIPLLPNHVQISGIGIKKHLLPPVKDISKFVERQKTEGVIYVNLGSKSEFIPDNLMVSLTSAVESLNYTFIWQYDTVDLNKYKNVLARKSLSQQEILNDSRTKLFIASCSEPDMLEAAYFGLPLVALPTTFDQQVNAIHLQRRRMGFNLDWENTRPEEMVETIKTLLTDQELYSRLQTVSSRLKGHRMQLDDQIAWWVEHAAKFNDSYRASDTFKHFCSLPDVQAIKFAAMVAGFVMSGFIIVIYKLLYFTSSVFKAKKD